VEEGSVLASVDPEVNAKLRKLKARLERQQRQISILEEGISKEVEERERFVAELTVVPAGGVVRGEYEWVAPEEGQPGYEQGQVLVGMIERVTAMASERIRQLFVGIQEELLAVQDQDELLAAIGATSEAHDNEENGGDKAGATGEATSSEGHHVHDAVGDDGGGGRNTPPAAPSQAKSDLANKAITIEGLFDAVRQRLTTQAEFIADLESQLRYCRTEVKEMERRVAALTAAAERKERGEVEYRPEQQAALANSIRLYAVRQMMAWEERTSQRKSHGAFLHWIDLMRQPVHNAQPS